MAKFLIIFIMAIATQAKAVISDYEYLPYLDENISFGLGMSYSKLESNSTVGNFYLLSSANPRFEVSYAGPIKEGYRHKFSGSLEQEVFRPENDTFIIKDGGSRIASTVAWQPMWVSDSKTFVNYFKFMAKNGQIISEIPTVNTVYGDIGDRYALDVGLGFNWYGLTVSKYPMSLDAEVLYSQTLFDHSATSVYNGVSYRLGISFEFKRRTFFAGWGARGYYEYDDIKNSYSHVVHKEIGLMLSKSILF